MDVCMYVRICVCSKEQDSFWVPISNPGLRWVIQLQDISLITVTGKKPSAVQE